MRQVGLFTEWTGTVSEKDYEETRVTVDKEDKGNDLKGGVRALPL